MPFSNWIQLAFDEAFDGSGNFTYTDFTSAGDKARFYLLTVP
ncbi:MAG: hypothetical protein WDN00_13490 [Limisphaerales bacterium]